MNLTRKIPLLSSFSPNATGLGDSIITSPIKVGISTITVNFAKISQNSLNFAARVSLLPAQKTQKNQKTTATSTSCGFTLCN
jgi:hypothetical protein